MHRVEAFRNASPNRQSMCARGGSAVQATNIKSASQLPVEYYFTDDLFDKYPPPADMEIDQADFAELRTELLGQKTGGSYPAKSKLRPLSALSSFCCTVPIRRIGRNCRMWCQREGKCNWVIIAVVLLVSTVSCCLQTNNTYNVIIPACLDTISIANLPISCSTATAVLGIASARCEEAAVAAAAAPVAVVNTAE